MKMRLIFFREVFICLLYSLASWEGKGYSQVDGW